MKKTLFLVLFLASINAVFAQSNDPVLFTVDGDPIHVSEFDYIYKKTNGDKATYSAASINEYLDLYKKFKLKVARAKEMRLDTIPALKKELEGYRRQLANSYLIDRNVTESLIKEVYDRQDWDIQVSHIFMANPKNGSLKETLAIKKKMNDVKKKIDGGLSFDKAAKEFSEDKNSAVNGGDIGYITSMLPSGFYELENAAYNTSVGKVSNVFKTKIGFHIVKVIDKRKARGKMKIAHIFVANDKKNPNVAKTKIQTIYTKLQKGQSWEMTAKEMSEDKKTANKGGDLGLFGINQYEKVFENAAFSLTHDGDYSRPVQSSSGWHIIKRIEKQEKLPYKLAKNKLGAIIKRDSRFEKAKNAMITKIKSDGKFQESTKALNAYIRSLDEDYLTYKWKPAEEPNSKVIFSLGGENYIIADFEKFAAKASRKRMRMGKDGNISPVVKSLYNDFVRETCLAYEERQLDKKYPEFKSLMREYEEGILLFEATKKEVWDKASQDSAGIVNFYNTQVNPDKYKWMERAEVTTFIIPEKNAKLLPKLRKWAKKKSTSKVLKKMNKKKKILTVDRNTYEKGKNKDIDKLAWKANTLSDVFDKKKTKRFYKVEKVIPPARKTLNEARGYIIADYQEYLEKEWIIKLQNEHKIEVNEDVLKKLIKK